MNAAGVQDPQDGDHSSFGGTESHDADASPAVQTKIKEGLQTDQEMDKELVVEEDTETSRLKGLATDVRDQDDLERDIGRQV